LNTAEIEVSFSSPADGLLCYSEINRALLGKLPICHFGIYELMFISKEECSLSNYYDWYIRPWTPSKDVILFYLDNMTREKCQCGLQDFPERLKRIKYTLVYGFKAMDHGEIFYFSEPKMIKD
jgi:hypothetical protein